MTDLNSLHDLLHQKIAREADMSQKVIQLQEASTELSLSRVGRWFGSSYLLLKRILSLLTAIFLLFTAFYFMSFPEELLSERETKELVEESKNDYYNILGESLGHTIAASFKSDQPFSPNRINREFTKAMEHILLEELYLAIRLLAFLLIPLALFLLYISRLTRKMRLRNHKISEAQKLSQEVIIHYSETRDALSKEIEILKNILHPNNQEETTS